MSTSSARVGAGVLISLWLESPAVSLSSPMSTFQFGRADLYYRNLEDERQKKTVRQKFCHWDKKNQKLVLLSKTWEIMAYHKVTKTFHSKNGGPQQQAQIKSSCEMEHT
jgi:hypothetical protein